MFAVSSRWAAQEPEMTQLAASKCADGRECDASRHPSPLGWDASAWDGIRWTDARKHYFYFFILQQKKKISWTFWRFPWIFASFLCLLFSVRECARAPGRPDACCACLICMWGAGEKQGKIFWAGEWEIYFSRNKSETKYQGQELGCESQLSTVARGGASV